MSGVQQSRLDLKPAAATPSRPTWFDVVAGQENRLLFDDLAELARHVVQLAAGQGLRIAAAPATTAASGLDLFPAWSVYALDDAGGEAWLGQAAIQSAPRERLEAAIRTALEAAGRQRAAA